MHISLYTWNNRMRYEHGGENKKGVVFQLFMDESPGLIQLAGAVEPDAVSALTTRKTSDGTNSLNQGD